MIQIVVSIQVNQHNQGALPPLQFDQAIGWQFTAGSLSAGSLIDLLVCLDQLGFQTDHFRVDN